MRVIARKINSIVSRLRPGERSIVTYRLDYENNPSNPGIVHFNGNFVIGGTTQLIADIIERTSDKFSHHVIVPHHPRPLPYQPVSISAIPPGKMEEIRNYLIKHRPSLVHIHYWIRPEHEQYDFGIWYREVFRICEDLKIKVIQNINVPTKPFAASNIVHNVFVSHYVRDEFNDQPAIKNSVIYPGSDLDFFDGNSKDEEKEYAIGMVYRLDPDKLNEEAIEIFIESLKQDPKLKCYIIGGGTFLDRYKRRVKEEGLGQRFCFTGYIPYAELPDLYKKIDLIIAPVHDESFGQVTPFAMGMGLPVAGFDTGAIPEILGSKETLTKSGDRSSLVRIILELMQDPQRRNILGKRNRKRASDLFTVEKMIRGYEDLYAIHAVRT